MLICTLFWEQLQDFVKQQLDNDPMLPGGRDAGALNYYKSILDTTEDSKIKVFAKEFAEEESGHVAELTKWLAAQRAGRPLPVDR